MAEIVILGAGLTGLSAAYHLEQNGFFNYKLFEKDKTVGGLCRSITQDGFTFDYTGHLLHINDAYFQSFIEKIAGFDNFNTIKRRSFIYSQDRYTHYPYQMHLHGLPPTTIAECIEGFLKRKKSSTPPTSFYSWVLTQFGTGFGNHFFFPYQEKIFSYPVKKLSASWTGRFVPQTSLTQIIQGAISDTSTNDIGYNAQFFYPKQGGIAFWVNKMAQKLHNSIATEYTVKKIDTITKQIFFTNGHVESYKHLITTLPLDTLLSLIVEPSNNSLKGSARKLKCNSVVNFNLGINRPHVSDKHWIYYPEKNYPFYRIGFPHNFSEHMAPSGMSSLYGEFSHIKADNTAISHKLTQALDATRKILHLSQDDIITEKIIHISHAYVIYDRWRDAHINDIHTHLGTYNISSVGRYGAWKYSSMQEGLLDGKTIAEQLLLKNYFIKSSLTPEKSI